MTRVRSRIVCGGVLLALLLLHGWMAITAAARNGLTFDEPGHVTSGYAIWTTSDYRLNAEGGVLATRVAALPLLASGLNPLPVDSERWQAADARTTAHVWFYQRGNDFIAMIARARAPIALFSMALVGLVWCWSKGLFGPRAAGISAVLAAFSPTLLAHGGLATTDVVLSFCLLAALSACWMLWHKVTLPRVIVAGALCGLTFLAKMSGLLLLPLLMLLFGLRLARLNSLPLSLPGYCHRLGQPRQIIAALAGVAAAVALISVAVIWAGYGFRFSATPAGDVSPASFSIPWSTVLGRDATSLAQDGAPSADVAPTVTRGRAGFISDAVGWARDHRLLPEAFLWGVAHTVNSARARPAFFAGEYSDTGWRWFFPDAFLLKSTPTEFLLFICGVSALALGLLRSIAQPKLRARCARQLYRAAPLLVLFIGYWAVAMSSGLNIGHRHLLPIYPVVFVFAGAAGLAFVRWKRGWACAALGSLLVLHVVESARARPFYLSYFTPVVGGSERGWRYLVDSSFDWGQGLPALQTWMEAKAARSDRAPVFLTYFGSDSPRARHLPVIRFADWADDLGARQFPAAVRGGWFAIGATHFQRVYLDLRGPWSTREEELYRETAAAFARTMSNAGARPEATEGAVELAKRLEVLRFGRLCHSLQFRTPEQIVGGSILLFCLNDAEVSFALNAPLEEVNASLNNHRRN